MRDDTSRKPVQVNELLFEYSAPWRFHLFQKDPDLRGRYRHFGEGGFEEMAADRERAVVGILKAIVQAKDRYPVRLQFLRLLTP